MTLSRFAAERIRPLSNPAAVSGVSAVACFVVAVTALHLLPTGLDPIGRTVSEYVNEPYGWLVPVAGLAMAIGSAAVTLALAATLDRSRMSVRTGLIMLGSWTVAMLLVAVFPADPAPPAQPIRWTAAGVVHVVAGAVAFISLPVAAVLISRTLPGEGGLVRTVRVLGAAAPAGLAFFLLTIVNRPPVSRLIGEPLAHGLGERVMIGEYAAWLLCAALWARRA